MQSRLLNASHKGLMSHKQNKWQFLAETFYSLSLSWQCLPLDYLKPSLAQFTDQIPDPLTLFMVIAPNSKYMYKEGPCFGGG